MGRVVHEERVASLVDDHLREGLVGAASARLAGLEPGEFEARVEVSGSCMSCPGPLTLHLPGSGGTDCTSLVLQRLLALLPCLTPRISRLRPELLAGLVTDIGRAAARLIELRGLLPGADVAAVLGQRPLLLLDGEWEQIPAGVAGLRRHFSEEQVARMVAQEPLLLLEDIDQVLRDLQRLLPGQDAAAALATQPGLATRVLRLDGLSIW